MTAKELWLSRGILIASCGNATSNYLNQKPEEFSYEQIEPEEEPVVEEEPVEYTE